MGTATATKKPELVVERKRGSGSPWQEVYHATRVNKGAGFDVQYELCAAHIREQAPEMDGAEYRIINKSTEEVFEI